MPGVSRLSNQYLNFMWSVYRSSDNSRQCHGVAKNTVERRDVNEASWAWGRGQKEWVPGRTTQRTSTRTSSVVSLGDSLPLLPRISKRSLTAHTAITASSALLQNSQHSWSSLNKGWRESVVKPRPNFKHSGGYVTSGHTVANGWNGSALPVNWVGSAATAVGCAAQPRRRSTQVQSMTGTEKHAYICKYANQRYHWTLR